MSEYKNEFEQFINKPEVQELVGPNFDKYKDLWKRDINNWDSLPDKKKASIKTKSLPDVILASHILCNDWKYFFKRINWAFIFLPMAWLGYRKLYVEAALYTLLLTCLSVADIAFGYPLNNAGVYLAMNLFISNYLTQFRVFKRVYKTFLSLPASPDQRKEEIKKKGGTTIVGAIIVTILSIGFMFLVLTIVVNSIAPQQPELIYLDMPAEQFLQDSY